jgi:hypothetical protein
VEIQNMMMTVKGATAGAIMMEWNVHESGQGAAGLWGMFPFSRWSSRSSRLTLLDRYPLQSWGRRRYRSHRQGLSQAVW